MLKRFIKTKSIILDGQEFSIKYTMRKNMRRMLLRVQNRSEIQISMPKRVFSDVSAFIQENKNWILKQNSLLKEPFCEDSSFFFRAKEYKIKHHLAPLSLLDSEVFLDPQKAKKQTDEFYKKEAKKYLPKRVEFLSKKMSLEFKRLRFHCTKRKWGSCNSEKVITLNPYMMKFEDEMIDYIIIHELAHLKHLNHSKEFYALVQTYMPHYKSVEKRISLFNT